MRAKKRSKIKLFSLIVIFKLFQKNIDPEGTPATKEKLGDEESEFGRIRCPLCQWQPKLSDTWCCSDCDYPEYFYKGCGTVWNTFRTHGLCPGCKHQWQWTICLRCHGWALHEQWYKMGSGKG